mgnify:CR=1 FL=1
METKQLNFNNLENALSEFTKEFVSNYKSLLLRDGKKASGNLISSLNPVSIQFTNNKIEADISIASYWKYVEYGRRPGKFPPINKILNWIKVKPVIPRPMNGLKPPTEPQLAFLIARKIARDGIKAGNQFKEALDMTWNRHYNDISNAISEDLNQAIDLVTLL